MKDPIMEATKGMDKDFKEAIDKANPPEAPASVTIRGYYKGYSVLLTNRDESVKMSPLLKKAMIAIDWMENNDFKPSWDDKPKPASSGVNQKTCPHTNTVVRVSKSEKNPNRSFKYCTDCRGFVGWVD